MGLSLSGWLPSGTDKDGLSRVVPRLVAAFDFKRRKRNIDNPDLEVVLVAVARVTNVRVPTDPEADHGVSVRLLHVEAVDGPEADQVRAMLVRLGDSRAGVQSLPLDELPPLDDPAPVAGGNVTELFRSPSDKDDES